MQPQTAVSGRSSGRAASWIAAHPRAVLLFLGIAVFTSGWGARDPWPPDEPRFALIGRDMVEKGIWLIPHRVEEPYSDKPPLFMWAIALAYAGTGSVRLSFLLPNIVAGLVALLAFHGIARRLHGPRTAFIGSVLLLLSAQFTLQAKFAQIDMFLCMWTTLALYGLLRHLHGGPAWGWYYSAFAFMGLGVISKGVGFLPALILVPYAVGRWRRWRGLPDLEGRSWKWALGLAPLLAVVALWLVPMLVEVARSGSPELAAYRDDILFGQTVQRYAQPTAHRKWFGYFLVNAPIIWLPGTLLLPWAIPAWRRRLRRRDARPLLLLGWTALVILFFSCSKGKRVEYLLPALPAFVLALAPVLRGILRRGTLEKPAAILLGAGAAAALLAGAALLVPSPLADELAAQDISASGGAVMAFAAAAVLAAAFAGALRGRRDRRPALLAGGILGVWVVAGWLGAPVLNPARTPEAILDAAEERMGPRDELTLVGIREQFFLFNRRPVHFVGLEQSRTPAEEQVRKATRWLAAAPGRWIIIRDDWEKWWRRYYDKEKLVLLGERHGEGWLLGNAGALKP